MGAELILAEEAQQDLDQAYDWYEQQRVGLGEDFLGAVEACLQNLARMPEAHRTIHENYRRVLVRRFPYAVIYEHVEDVVTVYAVFHTSRNPDVWRERLG